MNDTTTISKADGLRAIADLIDRGLPALYSVHLGGDRAQPTLYIHRIPELELIAGLVDGPVTLTWDTPTSHAGWNMTAQAGPIHIAGKVFADRIFDPTVVDGVNVERTPHTDVVTTLDGAA